MPRRLFAPRVVLVAVLALVVVLAAAVLVSISDDGDLTDATSTTSAPPLMTSSTTSAPAVVASHPPLPAPTTTETTTTTVPPPPTTDAPGPVRPSGAAAPPPPPPPSQPESGTVAGPRCIVRLHGKGGGAGGIGVVGDGLVELRPGGNAAAWGGREWRYFPDAEYGQARGVVAQAVEQAGCGPVVIYGFSNGAAFAAKLYCRGETFGGRLRGVVIDDPVVDHAVARCSPARGVRVALYWTGALEPTAQPGWDCASGDWTCEGGSTIGIDAYQAALGVGRKQSPHSTHTPYESPPELHAWW